MRTQLKLGATLAIGQAAGRGGLALVLLLLVRHLSATDFGTLSLALAFVAIGATVADAGFARLLVRDTARAGEASLPLVRELLRVRLLSVAAVALVATFALVIGLGPFTVGFGLLTVGYLVCESLAFGYENASAGAERPWRFVLAQASAGCALIGGTGALIIADAVTLRSTMAVLLGASALKVGAHLIAWRGRSGPVLDRPRRALFREALPFLGLTLLATVYYRVNVVSLYAVRGPKETADYAVAFRVIDVIAIVAGIGFLAASPALSRMHRDAPEEIWATWKRIMRSLASAAVPAIVVTGLAARPLCEALFGSRYATSAATNLRLLLPGAVLMVMQSVSAAVVFMSDDHGSVLKLTAANVCATVVMSISLSAALGSPGAAIAMSLAEALSFGTFALLIRCRHGESMPVEAALMSSQVRPDL